MNSEKSEKSEQKVYFPAVGEQGQLACVNVFSHESSSEVPGILAHGYPIDKEKEFNRILGLTRHKESGPKAKFSVGVSLDECDALNLNGQSYGLALAIADKCARLGLSAQTVIATGGIKKAEQHCASQVEAECIEHFQQKLALCYQATITLPCVLVYPADNPTTQEEQRLLQALKEKGITLRPIHCLDEVADLWGAALNIKRTSSMKSIVTTVLLLLALAFMAYKLGWLESKPPPQFSHGLPKPDCSAPALDTQRLRECLGLIDPQAFKLRYMYRRFAENFQHEQQLTRQLNTPAPLNTGDKLKLHFTPPQESYVYLFYLSPHGKLQELTEQHHVVPGQEYVLPSNDYSFEMTRETGLGILYFLAFEKENFKLQAVAHQLQQAHERGDTATAKALGTKLLHEYLEGAKPLIDILDIQHLPLEEPNHA